MIETQAVESCPFCGAVSAFDNYDVSISGYIVKCQSCGEEMMLCDECRHADDNTAMRCDWHSCPSRNGRNMRGMCFRGITHHMKEDC